MNGTFQMPLKRKNNNNNNSKKVVYAYVVKALGAAV